MLQRLLKIARKIAFRAETLAPEVPTYADEGACALEILSSPSVRALYTSLDTDPAEVEARVRDLHDKTRTDSEGQGWSPGKDWLQHIASVAPTLPPEVQLLVRLCAQGSPAIKQALAPNAGSPADVLFLVARKGREAELRSLWPLLEEQTGNVILLNDHFTPMEMVVSAIESSFGLSRERAIAQMLEIHRTGTSVFPISRASNATDTCIRLNREWREQGVSLYCVPERVAPTQGVA